MMPFRFAGGNHDMIILLLDAGTALMARGAEGTTREKNIIRLLNSGQQNDLTIFVCRAEERRRSYAVTNLREGKHPKCVVGEFLQIFQRHVLVVGFGSVWFTFWKGGESKDYFKEHQRIVPNTYRKDRQFRCTTLCSP